MVAASDDHDGARQRVSAAGAHAGERRGGRAACRVHVPGPGLAVSRAWRRDSIETEPVVRRAIDRCARILEPELGADLRKLLFPPQRRRAQAAEELRDTRWAQPALFVVGYALAELWGSWGVRPAAMIGHSVGEYVAATLAGVMTLEDALRLIARRGQLISALPRGSMLAVMAPAEALEHFVGGDVSLAAMNAPGFSVLSGPDRLIDDVEAALEPRIGGGASSAHVARVSFGDDGSDPRRVRGPGRASAVVAHRPCPFATTLTGDWANGDVTQPGYWSAQLRSTVRFADAVRAVVQKKAPAGKDSIFLEIGPGNTLVTFAAETARGEGASARVSSRCRGRRISARTRK